MTIFSETTISSFLGAIMAIVVCIVLYLFYRLLLPVFHQYRLDQFRKKREAIYKYSLESSKLADKEDKILSVSIPLPHLLTMRELFNTVVERTEPIEHIYSIFSILISNEEDTVKRFISLLHL